MVVDYGAVAECWDDYKGAVSEGETLVMLVGDRGRPSCEPVGLDRKCSAARR